MAGPVGEGGDEFGVEVEEVPGILKVEGAVQDFFPLCEGLPGYEKGGFIG